MSLSAIQTAMTTIYEAYVDIPCELVLPPKLFAAVWSEARQRCRVQFRPGFFTSEDRPIDDAGNPVIELETGHGVVRIRCSAPIYQRALEQASTPAPDDGKVAK